MSKVLITGASGFLGKYIYNHFKSQKYDLLSLGVTEDCDIICDFSKEVPQITNDGIDMVVHIAGKAHVIPKTEEEKKSFFDVNLQGTKNVVNAFKKTLPKTIVFISTVAVYGVEIGENIDENHPLLGDTPYARSKIEAEEFLVNFGKEKGVNIVILRLPLISGANPPGNLGAMIKAIIKGYYFRIGKGTAERSIVSATDIAEIIPTLIDKNGIYNLTDGLNHSFKEIDTYIANLHHKKIKVLPTFILHFFAILGDYIPKSPLNSLKFSKMTKSLTFSDKKAVSELNWKPKNSLHYIK